MVTSWKPSAPSCFITALVLSRVLCKPEDWKTSTSLAPYIIYRNTREETSLCLEAVQQRGLSCDCESQSCAMKYGILRYRCGRQKQTKHPRTGREQEWLYTLNGCRCREGGLWFHGTPLQLPQMAAVCTSSTLAQTTALCRPP